MKGRSVSALAALAAALFAVAPALATDELFSPRAIDRDFERRLLTDRSFEALALDPATARLDLVDARAELVTATREQLGLEVAPGLALRAHRTGAYLTHDGQQVWSGVIEDPGTIEAPWAAEAFGFDPLNTVTLVRDRDMVTGTVHFNGEVFQIRPLRSGGHAIVALDPSAMPPDHPEEYKKLKTVAMPTTPDLKANTVIRVMVHYTSSAASASGNISSLVNLAIAETNQGYTNSGVQITVQLAHSSQVTYTQSGSFSTDLSRYRGTSDGYMDSIHTTRNSVAADVGVLLINNSSSCGLASSIGSTAATAFAVAHWSCATGYYSFGHEIGHLQSARHDPATDPSTSPYAYGHGYRYTGSPSWRTIMAYNCPAGCPRLNYWSNPTKLYNGVPMGTASQSDNARVLNNTRATIAAFR